jgi:hypothetical protein
VRKIEMSAKKVEGKAPPKGKAEPSPKPVAKAPVAKADGKQTAAKQKKPKA